MTVNRRLLIGGAAALGVAGAGWLGWRQMGSASDMAAYAATLRQDLPATPGARDLIRYATLAANSHNTQAWRFRESPSGIDILPDPTRATPVVDPDDHHLFISLGGAAENLTLAMAARGQGGELTFDPTTGTLSLPYGTTRATDTSLFDAIPARQSTRSDYDGTPVSPADLGLLAAAATMPGVDLFLITEPDPATGAALVDLAVQRFGGLEVLVNNAGVFNPKPFLDLTEADYDWYLDTILKGKFFTAQAATKAMKVKGGAIVQTGSMWAIQAVGATPLAAYSAANAGVHAMVRNLAIELAPLGIRINAVAPAVVETPVYNTFLTDAQVAEVLPTYNAFHPLGRNGQPRDVAEAILFLASDQASWITGTVLPVDGGVTAGRQ